MNHHFFNSKVNGIFRDPQQWDPLMVSFPYHSHIFRDSNMGVGFPGIVWVPAYHKGVPLLGVPRITLDKGLSSSKRKFTIFVNGAVATTSRDNVSMGSTFEKDLGGNVTPVVVWLFVAPEWTNTPQAVSFSTIWAFWHFFTFREVT